jgi:ABC-type transport system involved in Fe-S cluster assembly fused permease/ATPase subunit
MIRYSIAMTVRMVCIVLAILVQGWFMWVCFALAIVLPYWAVVIANSRGEVKPNAKATAVTAPRIAISADQFRETKD